MKDEFGQQVKRYLAFINNDKVSIDYSLMILSLILSVEDWIADIAT